MGIGSWTCTTRGGVLGRETARDAQGGSCIGRKTCIGEDLHGEEPYEQGELEWRGGVGRAT